MEDTIRSDVQTRANAPPRAARQEASISEDWDSAKWANEEPPLYATAADGTQ